MSGPRAQCPVPTCLRDMPAAQVMCAHCWGKVPKDLRKSIDGTDPLKSRRPQLVRQAIACAQGDGT